MICKILYIVIYVFKDIAQCTIYWLDKISIFMIIIMNKIFYYHKNIDVNFKYVNEIIEKIFKEEIVNINNEIKKIYKIIKMYLRGSDNYADFCINKCSVQFSLRLIFIYIEKLTPTTNYIITNMNRKKYKEKIDILQYYIEVMTD